MSNINSLITFGQARFHVSLGPMSLFERIRFKMKGRRELLLSGSHFLRCIADGAIPTAIVETLQYFDAEEWVLLSAEVRVDNGEFVSSSWGRKIGKRYYVITIGYSNFVETIYETVNLDAKLHANGTGCYVTPQDKLYNYVERVNYELMHNNRSCDSREKNINIDSKGVKSHKAEIWKINPFEGIEKNLPIDVVKIDEWSRTALEVLDNPIVNWPERYSKEAYVFKILNTSKDLRYRVASFVNKAESLADNIEELELLFVNGHILQVSGDWKNAFGVLLSFLVENKREQLEALDVSGLLQWVRSDIQGKSALASIEDGSALIEFPSLADLCRKSQWLLIMSGFNLDTVAVQFKSNENFLQKIAERERRIIEERAREKKRKNNYDRQREKLMTQIMTGSKTRRQQDRSSFGVGENPFGNKAKYASIPTTMGIRFDDGTYIVQDGVVVFVKRHEDGTSTINGNVIRSNEEHPEEWNGYGVSARETDGRYGGIIAEDWID